MSEGSVTERLQKMIDAFKLDPEEIVEYCKYAIEHDEDEDP